MNKHIIWLFTLLVFVLAGCEKDEIGNTATEALAGEWKVTVDAVMSLPKISTELGIS